MDRFIRCNNFHMNVSQIKRFQYMCGQNKTIIELVDGEELICSGDYTRSILGEDEIVQIIPCKEELVAVDRDGNYTRKIQYIALLADGHATGFEISNDGCIELIDDRYTEIYTKEGYKIYLEEIKECDNNE